MIKEEHNKHCREISEELDRIVNGEVFYCHECAERIYWDGKNDAPEVCECCGEELWQMDLVQWLSDSALSIDVVVNLDITKAYGVAEGIKGARVMVAYGGPSIYVDTEAGAVKLYWWDERGEWPLSRDVCRELDELVVEISEY